MAGAASWLPIYPIDIVKTLQQAGSGSEGNFLAITRKVYRRNGIAGFFDGVGPKLMRAVVNHAATFYVFEKVMLLWRVEENDD
jgi:hypothetical protein